MTRRNPVRLPLVDSPLGVSRGAVGVEPLGESLGHGGDTAGGLDDFGDRSHRPVILDLDSNYKPDEFQFPPKFLAYPSRMEENGDASNAWHHRLAAEMQRLGWNKTKLAEESGVPYDSVNKYLRGDVDQPRGNAIEKLALAVGVEPVYLREGLRPGPPVGEDVTPIKGKVAAGAWLEVGVIEDPVGWLPFNPLPQFPKGSVFALIVDGDSMNKIAKDGDTIICVDLGITGISLRDNDIAIVERRRQQEGLREVTAKRVHFENGELWLVPESTNPKWQTAKFRLSDCPDDIELRVIAKLEYVLSKPEFSGA